MELQKDFKELLALFNAHDVKYLEETISVCGPISVHAPRTLSMMMAVE